MIDSNLYIRMHYELYGSIYTEMTVTDDYIMDYLGHYKKGVIKKEETKIRSLPYVRCRTLIQIPSLPPTSPLAPLCTGDIL